MKKINSQREILGSLLMAFIFASIAPVNAASVYDNYPNRVYGQAGLNQMHDTDFLKDRYVDEEQQENYYEYERSKDPNYNNVIDNYNNQNYYQKINYYLKKSFIAIVHKLIAAIETFILSTYINF